MSIDLTGITNKNEYYTNHYFSTVFEENTSTTISNWNAAARDSEEIKTPWSLLRQNARQYYTAHDKFVRSSVNLQVLANIKALAGSYLKSLGYPEAKPEVVAVDDSLSVPVYLEMTKSNGAPLLWVLLSASKESDAGIMESFVFNADDVDDDAAGTLYKGILGEMANEDLVTKILFGTAEPPRFIMLIGMNQIALIDRNKWNEKRYLQFELEEIFSRLENTTLQAMSVLLHKDSLCPDDGKVLLDELDEQSQKNASGVSQDLKYALRESIELLGNEVLYDMKTRLGRDLDADPVDAGQLTLECLRYMYRMLFVLFIEARPELGYAPIKAQSYYSGYSLESLRDIADNIRDDVNEVGDGYYLHETLAKLYELIYDGYPKTEDELKKATGSDSLHDMFLIAPLKAHIFDPEYTKMITAAKLRNSCMLRIIDLMSLTRATGRKNSRRGRISYANLGINQMGAVYEALLSYRGFIAEHDLYEVKRAGDSFNELDVGYFVSESELDQYTEDERVRYESGEKAGKLRMYEKGTFIYRLAGREREKSASYYTPEVLTKCLVKYALKELLEGKTADEILKLTICEPAMGSAAFLNEAINQLAEAYISRKEKETGEIISYEKRFNELQKVKMFIADRNVYGIDLNPVAVELAEVSLWLNTIYEGGFVPWFGTQLVNGNSLIGARRQVYRIENAQSTSKGLRWYEIEPERVPLGTKRMPKKQVYHFLLGDPGMCSYSDKVIKQLEPANIKEMKDWNAFEDLKKQQDTLRTSVDALKAMIRDLEDKPKDSSYDEEIKELKREEAALLTVLQEIGKKNIFNFLSDEGLLPNYAFPEAGIILRAVLYRKEDEETPAQKKKYEKMVYEYSRSASSAISEFAPNNSFYVDGRKLTIDQVDLTTAQTARWRLCPNCSHAQIEETGKNTSACPQCGSPAWADAGQVRTMLKVQMVYSNMDYTKSLINDESDDRNNVFYCKQLLVDVDEDHDISSAYRMDNEDFPFGYEFVRKATLREINFGESDMTGEKLSVSGVEEVRKGFRICKYCGKIQPENGKANHSFACKTRKMPTLMQADAYEECLFLYREFSTEILRLLVPATTMDSSSVKMESFVAAFMLGMKEYFGNVDHLRATVSEVPVPDADYRKQYLVIYDSVPGGTGYLKQLMHEKNALIEIFERALHVMENCSCKDDPQKDGCYHCLYAYRQSQQIGNISRTTAIRILKSILSGKDNVQKIDKINDIPVNPLFDSELEQRFMEAIRTKVGAANVSDTIRNGKHSYYVKIENFAWEIEPQVLLDAGSGVSVDCKPDFVFWPVSAPEHKPVAVFTDGFLYHKDIVSDDTIKREAIRRSGNFRIWSLSFKDVQSVFAPQGDFYTTTLEAEKMPSGKTMYQNMIKKQNADVIEPAKLSSFDLLLEYLKLPDAERVFKGQAYAYSLSLLEPALMKNNLAFNNWETIVKAVNDQTHFTNANFVFPGTIFGSWIPRTSNAHLAIHSAILASELKAEGAVAVCAVLNDEKDRRTDKYEQEWNGLWRFYNVMQFSDEFIAVSSVGMSHMDYLALPVAINADSDIVAPVAAVDDAWNAIKELLFDDDAKAFVEIAKDAGVPAPDEDNIGYEVEGDDGEVVATVEIAWPDRRIGFMTAEQAEDKEKLEKLGWRILNLLDIANMDVASYFGGDNQ